ncbi:UNVERIFIED_CONTAM: Retrovirus-related Pol polyprotein from transposon TNT 1-94 [Sesamum calycinum]|uniref:Retrovirus-related Pol polyprotein from transposon TNT 1-94 n=1 Tax=Sesamum calycinum TaxID=2727403 RepID=A0AAW2P9M5_9LAMI
MQCSWKEVFQGIPDAMNCSLRNQVRHLSRMQGHRLRLRFIDNVPILRRSSRAPQPPERYGFLGMTSQLDNDPKTYGEAKLDIDSRKWLEAMKSEMDSMISNQVWMLVDRPKGVRPVGCKWVYKHKIGADGEVTTFKAKLVAKGYTQRLGVDFEKTFLPVGMAKFIRIMHHSSMPEDFMVVGEEQKVCHLRRSIYGLKQASRSWNICFDEVIRGYDFVKNDFDPCVYKKCTRPDIAYALSVTSRYQLCAGEARWTAVKNILKYLRRTKDIFLVYGGGELILEGFSNASFQSDDDDGKSQSGFVFKLNGGVVAWKSSKQDTTTDSTMKVEYIAASKATKEAVWMKNNSKELAVVPSITELLVIFCDNNRAIAQAKELRSNRRSKHILRRYHLLREMVGRGDV